MKEVYEALKVDKTKLKMVFEILWSLKDEITPSSLNEVLIKMSYQARNRHLLSYNERQVNFYQFSKLMNIDRLLFEVH